MGTLWAFVPSICSISRAITQHHAPHLQTLSVVSSSKQVAVPYCKCVWGASVGAASPALQPWCSSDL